MKTKKISDLLNASQLCNVHCEQKYTYMYFCSLPCEEVPLRGDYPFNIPEWRRGSTTAPYHIFVLTVIGPTNRMLANVGMTGELVKETVNRKKKSWVSLTHAGVSCTLKAGMTLPEVKELLRPLNATCKLRMSDTPRFPRRVAKKKPVKVKKISSITWTTLANRINPLPRMTVTNEANDRTELTIEQVRDRLLSALPDARLSPNRRVTSSWR